MRSFLIVSTAFYVSVFAYLAFQAAVTPDRQRGAVTIQPQLSATCFRKAKELEYWRDMGAAHRGVGPMWMLRPRRYASVMLEQGNCSSRERMLALATLGLRE